MLLNTRKDAIKYPSYSEQDIARNKEALADMSAVATIDAAKLEKTGKSPKEMFAEYFASLGNAMYSEEFGDILLGNSSVKSEIRHGLTSEKIASMEAIPSVIEQGRVIFYESKINGDERVKRIVVEYEKDGLAQVNPQLHKWLAIVNESPSTNSIPDSGEKSNPSGKKTSAEGGDAKFSLAKSDGAKAHPYAVTINVKEKNDGSLVYTIVRKEQKSSPPDGLCSPP